MAFATAMGPQLDSIGIVPNASWASPIYHCAKRDDGALLTRLNNKGVIGERYLKGYTSSSCSSTDDTPWRLIVCPSPNRSTTLSPHILIRFRCLSFTKPLSYTKPQYRSAKFCSSESSLADISFVTTGIHSAAVVWRVVESPRIIIAPRFLLLQNTCHLIPSYRHIILARFLCSMTTNTELRTLKESVLRF